MIGFTHASLALLIGSLFFKNDGFAIFLVIIGSLLPDIDYPFSLLGQFVQRVSFWLNENYGHRGITHSWILLVIFFIPAIILNYVYGFALSLGILSHFLLDMLTNQGIQLLFPYNASFVFFNGRFETGSKVDIGLGISFSLLFLTVILL